MSDLLHRLLTDRPWLLADGATGTDLFAMGLQHGDAPELWNLAEPEKVRAHYRSFIDAGSDIVLTNSFGGTANRLKLHGAQERVREINAAAAALLREEIDAQGRAVVCAGSVGPTGDLFAPLGPLTHEEGVSVFREQCEGLVEGGAELAWIETMSAPAELMAVLEGAAAAGLPAVCTLSFDTNGRTMMGVAPGDLPELLGAAACPPVAYGGNCGTGASELVAAILPCPRRPGRAGSWLPRQTGAFPGSARGRCATTGRRSSWHAMRFWPRRPERGSSAAAAAPPPNICAPCGKRWRNRRRVPGRRWARSKRPWARSVPAAAARGRHERGGGKAAVAGEPPQRRDPHHRQSRDRGAGDRGELPASRRPWWAERQQGGHRRPASLRCRALPQLARAGAAAVEAAGRPASHQGGRAGHHRPALPHPGAQPGGCARTPGIADPNGRRDA